MLKLVVIDGQGGGLGKNLIEKIIRANVKDVDIIALGTQCSGDGKHDQGRS